MDNGEMMYIRSTPERKDRGTPHRLVLHSLSMIREEIPCKEKS